MSFPDATIRSIKHYILLTLEENQPDKKLLHLRTNDLSSAHEIPSKVKELMDVCKWLNIDIIIVSENCLSWK